MATIAPSEVPNNGDGASQKDRSTDPPSGGDTSRPTKKPRRADSLEDGHVASTRKQENLCQLNLDVLFLVVGHGIEPMDLLNLAYTCKSLRRLLMSKTSAFVWKAARRNVHGLPECPRDLSEPEYANLAFCAECHGCGKPITSVLWKLRRRYCVTCKRQHLCKLSSCEDIIKDVLMNESVAVKGEISTYVERSQMESLLYEYRRSCDKRQFTVEGKAQNLAIHRHALRCDAWHKKRLEEHKVEEAKCREMRKDEIFRRLHQLGYGSEIYYFGARDIRDSYRTFFMSPKLLTDQEWDRAWHVLREIMEDFRLDRLEKTVYNSRRRLLADEYSTYLEQRTKGKSRSKLFPHANDLAHFGPFQSIIKAPEEAKVDGQSFMAAFQELPDLADEWKKNLEGELAEVVKSALALPSSNNSGSRAQSSSVTKHPEVDLDILRLACAVFLVEDQEGSYAYPDVFFVARCAKSSSLAASGEGSQRTGSNLRKRFSITFLREASYIVRACGLDPSVATVDDMDHLNARLMCLSCTEAQSNSIMNWRMAMWHAREHKRIRSQWMLVSDEHIGAIQAVERSVKKKLFDYTRCLLCQSHVGCFIVGEHIRDHLYSKHGVKMNRARRGVHYAHVGIRDSPPKAEVVQGSVVTFRKSTLFRVK